MGADDITCAVEWFSENLIRLENVKGISVTYNREGQVFLLVSQENPYAHRLIMMWTDFLGNTGYQMMPWCNKYQSLQEKLPKQTKRWYEFWK